MAIPTCKAYTASLLTLSPYVVNTDVVKSPVKKAVGAPSSWVPEMTQGMLLAVRITALVLAIIATAGFAAALAFPPLNIPVIILGGAGLLTGSICLSAFSIFANQKKEPAPKSADQIAEEQKRKGPHSVEFKVLVNKENEKGKTKGLEEAKIDKKPIVISYYEEKEIKVSRLHQAARITAVALVVLAGLGIAAAALTTAFAFAPILPWVPLIALGSTIAFATGVSTFALSILSIYGKQRISTDKNRFDHHLTGSVLADHLIDSTTTLKDPNPAKPENVYLTRGEYRKYLIAQSLLAKNTREQGKGGTL